jgi:hypothetical protein
MTSILRTLAAHQGSLGQYAAAERSVLLFLQGSGGEMSMRELVDRVRAYSPHMTDLDIKRAVWRLIRKGELELSPERRLSARRQQRVDIDEENNACSFVQVLSNEATPSQEQQFQTAKGAA